MSIFWPLLKLQFFCLKKSVFFPKYRKTIFSDIISLKNSNKRKFDFCTIYGLTPFKNAHFLPLFKTSIFFYLKSFFSFHNIKNDPLGYYFCEKRWYEKVRFLDKIHGLTHLKNVHFLAFVKTSIFLSKKICFLSKISENDLFWHNFFEKQQ